MEIEICNNISIVRYNVLEALKWGGGTPRKTKRRNIHTTQNIQQTKMLRLLQYYYYGPPSWSGIGQFTRPTAAVVAVVDHRQDWKDCCAAS